MAVVKLIHPIHTLEDQIIFDKGDDFSTDILRELIASNKAPDFPATSLLAYGDVNNDLKRFIDNPPYKVIFSDEKQRNEILGVMSEVKLPYPILQSLDYFKKYDFHTYRHMLMIFALATLLGKVMMPDDKDSVHKASVGPTHDFGKICVPLSILAKPEPLTKSERNILEQHTTAGYALIAYYTNDVDSFAARVAREHHERRDSSGYPRGIAQNDTLVEIIAACDVYDALISPRPYRPVSYDNRTALEVLTEMAEKKEIGWNVVQALVAHNRKSKPHFKDFTVSPEKRGTSPPGNSYGITVDDEYVYQENEK